MASASSGTQPEKKTGNGKRPASETSSGRPIKISGGKGETSTTPTPQGLAAELGPGLQALIGSGDSGAPQDREGSSPSRPHSGLAPSTARLDPDGSEAEGGRQQLFQSTPPTTGGGLGFTFGHNGEEIMTRALEALLQSQASLRAEVKVNLLKNEEAAKNLRRSQQAMTPLSDWKCQLEYRRLSLVLMFAHNGASMEDVISCIELLRKHIKASDASGEWDDSNAKLIASMKKLCADYDATFDMEEVERLLVKEKASLRKPQGEQKARRTSYKRAGEAPATTPDLSSLISSLMQNAQPKPVCTFPGCNKTGHREDQCFMKYPDKRPKRTA
jgi:hypothetical protein